MRTRFNAIQERVLAVSEERGAFWLMVAVIVASFALYSMMVQQTIKNVVGRQQLETEMSVLNSRIGELEFKYISLRNDVTIDKAYAMGFKDVAETKFVSRKALSQVALSSIY